MCDCIKNINEHLAGYNTKITVPIWTASDGRPSFVETSKIDEKKRGKPKSVFASCCPFCGEKYSDNRPELRSGHD
jgi:hypothetical protein